MLLSEAGLEFVTARAVGTLTTLRRDGRPHMAPVGWTWDAEHGLARVICSGGSQKAVNARRAPPVALCQVDGRRWLTVEGLATVSADPARVAEAEARYTVRYRPPRGNPARVVLEIAVDRVLGTAEFRG